MKLDQLVSTSRVMVHECNIRDTSSYRSPHFWPSRISSLISIIESTPHALANNKNIMVQAISAARSAIKEGDGAAKAKAKQDLVLAKARDSQLNEFEAKLDA
jgi:hypothetical protein